MDNKIFSKVINQVFLISLLQGLSLILLGVLTAFYPQIVTWFVVFALIFSGISAIVTSVRIKQFGNELESVAKS